MNIGCQDQSKTIWVVRGGSQGELDSLFLQKNCVAIGWPNIGNPNQIPATREAFKAAVLKGYPDHPERVPGAAGMVYRFLHEMAVGDLVLYPSKIDRHIHVGEIVSSPKYRPELNADYPNLREVRWLRNRLSKSTFSQGALHEINSALTVFVVKNYADEVRNALSGKAAPLPPEEDPTIGDVARETEETTNDFIIKRLARELKGYPLQDFIAHLLNTMGYRTRVQQKGSDGGVDIIAHKDELGFEPPIIKVQVKATEGSNGDPEVSSLYGKVSPSEFGLFVTLGTFTPKAKALAQSKHNLRLIDGEELVQLILEHYEQFDSRYKSILPLKRVYVPEQVN